MTLAEFLHPIRASSKREQILAALYFYKHHEGQANASVNDVRQGLVRANIPRSRKANLSQALSNLIPLVERLGGGYWKITESGEKHVREQFALPDDLPQVHEDVSSLTRLARSVEDETVREYVEEAIKCLQVGARRAAVVFLWSGVVHDIRQRVWANGKRVIEDELKKRNPKAKFRRKDDFAYVKDSVLIELTADLDIFEKSERKRLTEALDLRNDCGHPVRYRPGEKKVSSFIEDLLQVVFGASSRQDGAARVRAAVRPPQESGRRLRNVVGCRGRPGRATYGGRRPCPTLRPSPWASTSTLVRFALLR